MNKGVFPGQGTLTHSAHTVTPAAFLHAGFGISHNK